MQTHPFQVVRDFEKAIAAYCGAKEAISCASCTAALLLALLWVKRKRGPLTITIPKRTYIGVGMSILNAGHDIAFDDRKWLRRGRAGGRGGGGVGPGSCRGGGRP